jgi:hypothetical protein
LLVHGKQAGQQLDGQQDQPTNERSLTFLAEKFPGFH